MSRLNKLYQARVTNHAECGWVGRNYFKRYSELGVTICQIVGKPLCRHCVMRRNASINHDHYELMSCMEALDE